MSHTVISHLQTASLTHFHHHTSITHTHILQLRCLKDFAGSQRSQLALAGKPDMKAFLDATLCLRKHY